jgi:integrase
MSRRHGGNGHVRLRNDVTHPYWQGMWSEYVSGELKQRSSNLGYADEITKTEARLRLQKLLVKVHDAERRGRRDPQTVRQYIEGSYEVHFLPLHKPSVKRSYTQIIQRHVLPALGSMEIDQVTRQDVQALITRLVKEGLSWYSLHNVRTVIRSVFREAIKDRLAETNPGTLINMPPQPAYFPPEMPSRETIYALLGSMPEPYQTFCWLTLVTGMRVGEITALKWKEVDFDKKLLWIKLAQYMGEFNLPKSHRSQRPIWLTDREVERLRGFRNRTPGATTEGWVFPHPLRGDSRIPMDEQHALRSMQKYAKPRGLHLTLHMLRKWLGTMLYYERVPLKVIQQRLGHADMRTTAKWYVHMQSLAEREGAEVASQLLDGVQQGLLWSSDGSETAVKGSLAATLAAAASTKPDNASSGV